MIEYVFQSVSSLSFFLDVILLNCSLCLLIFLDFVVHFLLTAMISTTPFAFQLVKWI